MLKTRKVERKVKRRVWPLACSISSTLGFSVTDDMRRRVQSSTDFGQLRLWIRRAAVIQSADELFDE